MTRMGDLFGFASWSAAYVAAAQQDHYAWIIERNGSCADEDTVRLGQMYTQQQLEGIGSLLGFRSSDARNSAHERNAARRFLERQAYGADPIALGCAFTIRLPTPGGDVWFNVDRLDEIDLEDLREVLYFERLDLESHVAPMNEALARSIVEALTDDMNFSGDEVELEAHVRGSILDIEIRELEAKEE